MIRTKIEASDRDLRVVLAADLSPEKRSEALAGFAQQALRETQDVNRKALGEEPSYETFVDGVRGAPLRQVKPDGTIIFKFDLVDDALSWIGTELVKASPVKTGKFADSHIVLADGHLVEAGSPLPPADEYAFVNTQPYARKIERGLSPQAPEGVFEAVAVMAARRFGNIGRVRFGYRSITTGGIASWAAGTTMLSGNRRGNKRQDWLTRQPAVIVTLR